MDDFDHVPKPVPVPYKYYEPAPKKRCERKLLPARPCTECEKYYASFPDSRERAEASCRHRARFERPKTPPHFFDLDFPDYEIPVEKHWIKPAWQNRYRVRPDPKLYDSLNLQLIPYFDDCGPIIEALEKEIRYLPRDSCRFRNKNVPRRVAAYGEEGTNYSFSGNTYRAEPWTPILKELRLVAHELTGTWFNFVLVNRYKNGSDYIGFHKDDEPDLEPHSNIVSFSFGAERQFVFKREHFPNYEMTLKSGSVLIMRPPTNRLWFHSLPKQENVKDFRINLTFRLMKPSRSATRRLVLQPLGTLKIENPEMSSLTETPGDLPIENSNVSSLTQTPGDLPIENSNVSSLTRTPGDLPIENPNASSLTQTPGDCPMENENISSLTQTLGDCPIKDQNISSPTRPLGLFRSKTERFDSPTSTPGDSPIENQKISSPRVSVGDCPVEKPND